MLIAALRDLQWRRRRFVIAIVGTAMVFAMTLVLTGLANGFDAEARRTVDTIGVTDFLIKDGSVGPFLGSGRFPQREVGVAAGVPGVRAATPLVYAAAILQGDRGPENVNVFGAPSDGPGMPVPRDGAIPTLPDEAAVSTTLGREIGESLEINSRTLRIVGLLEDSTALAGQANVFMTLGGAQLLLFSGQPLISSVAVDGEPQHTPQGYRLIGHEDAVADLLRPLHGAYTAMSYMAALLWAVAALIVGSLIYLSVLERTRDFAVFKAIGVPTRSVLAGLAMQAVIVASVSALLGAVLSQVIGPVFPMRVLVPVSAFVLLPVLAVGIGLLATGAGLRRTVRIDPALAFGGQ